MKKLYIPLLVILVGFAGLGIHNVTTTKNKLQLKEIQLKSTASDLKELELKYDHLNVELDKADKTNKDQIKQLQDEKVKLEQEKQKLEADLLAKRNAKDKANQASQAALALVGGQTAHASGGSKEQWMTAAGIPQHEWSYVDSIVSRESGWNPNAVNPSSGACGLGQQLPCGKWAGAWNDPVAALKAQYGYVIERYGGYAQAVSFWNSNHWY